MLKMTIRCLKRLLAYPVLSRCSPRRLGTPVYQIAVILFMYEVFGDSAKLNIATDYKTVFSYEFVLKYIVITVFIKSILYSQMCLCRRLLWCMWPIRYI